MASIVRFQRGFLQRARFFINKRGRSTATSASKCETTTPDMSSCKPPRTPWVSYGFDKHSEVNDRLSMHLVFFTSVTLCLVGGGYLFIYFPDFHLKDWAQREAYLELKRREEKGLPAIDKNLIDPRKITLPSEEEIGEMEIII